MAAIDLDYCFVNPNLYDFKADTLRKAIVKLHRLNAACHSSPDDWHMNLIEATKDLTDPVAQEQFYKYLSNPSGFTENKQLWDALEKFDKHYSDPEIINECQHDPFDASNFKTDSLTRGTTQYIFVQNKNWSPPVQHNLLEHVEEKSEDSDEEKINELLDDLPQDEEKIDVDDDEEQKIDVDDEEEKIES